MIITIDGPAAAGKGTLAAALAKKYNFAYFDTGMIYRAVGIQFIINNEDTKNEELAIKYAKELTYPKMIELSKNKLFRTPETGQAASITSVYPKLREALLKMQRDLAENPVFEDGSKAEGIVFDGRDTGTKICPNAEIKLFLTASLEERARRRHKELEEKGFASDYNAIYNDIKARDDRDYNRQDAPLKPADDASIIDTTELNIDQVIEKVSQIIEKKTTF